MPHEKFIRECFALAQKAVENGNHPFGALLVKAGDILLTAENTVITSNDCTAHAELNLVSQASNEFTKEILAKCTLYTSTEPCAMCSGAIYWSGIWRIVYGCSAKALGQITSGSLVIPCQDIFMKGVRHIEVAGPILEKEGRKIHENFWWKQEE